MIALYVRVSTQEQAKDGYSIDEQLERLKDYSRAMHWQEIRPYVDAGYSGGNTNRPDLQAMISDIKDGKITKVVVYKLDRLSRSQKDTLELIEDVFLANNCDFVSMTENFDTGTPFGRAMIGMLSVFAQLEREQIKERMNLGRTGRAKEGKFHGGASYPIGYDYQNGELIINEFEAMQVREMYDLFLHGATIRQISRTFAEKGYTHKYGPWREYSIRTALKNDVYLGMVHFAGETFQGNQEPIIDHETFRKAKKIWEARSEKYKRNGTFTNHSLLAGLIYCKCCGARYHFIRSRYNKDKHYYTCYSRSKTNLAMVKDPTCKNKNYRSEDLDSMILGEIRKLEIDPDYISRIKEGHQSDDEAIKEQVLSDQIRKLDEAKSRFMSLYGLGEFTVEELQAKVNPINDQKEKLQKEKDALRSRTPMTQSEAEQIVSGFGDILDKGTQEEIKLVINSLIERIDIDHEDVMITWRFS